MSVLSLLPSTHIEKYFKFEQANFKSHSNKFKI